MIWSNSKHLFIAKKSISSENLSKRMKMREIISHGFSTGYSMDMLDLLTGYSSISFVT